MRKYQIYMQSYFVVRGQADRMDRFKNDLLAQYMPYEYEPGKIGNLQLGLRKIELWELAYPEKCHDEVMKMMVPFDGRKPGMVSFLRRLLGLKTIREGSLPDARRVFRQDVSVMPVGCRKDKIVILKQNGIDFKRELI